MGKQLSLLGYWLGLLSKCSVPLWCSGWHQDFLHEFPSRCRAVAYDRELVSDGKVLS